MMLMSQPTTLRSFLQLEIDKRKMSARAFSRFVGVDSKTINKFLNNDLEEVGYPSVDFLLKLSKTTGIDIGSLMGLVDPNVPRIASIAPDAIITSQRIEQLPEQYREIIDDIIARHAK